MNRASAILILLTLLTAAPLGCTGGGQVKIVPLVRRDFPPDEPLIGEITLREAFHWMEDDGSLNFALGHERSELLGGGAWLMSIVLESPPAGRQRLYRAGDREVRTVQSQVGAHGRSQSMTGVVVIESAGGDRYRGRFHVWVRQQLFSVLSGWTPRLSHAPIQVLVGEFESVANAERGRAIRDRTESDGMERDAPDEDQEPEIEWLTPPPPTHPEPTHLRAG